MPFLPFVLFMAYQTVSRSARFALGWATALFFGQIPGNKGDVLAMVSLLSLGWVILVIGGGVPLLLMLAGERLEVIPFGLGLAGWEVAAIIAGCAAGPPAVAAVAEVGGFEADRSVGRWLRRVPVSFPVAASLGFGVLQMLLVAPFVTLLRIRRKRVVLQIPLLIRDERSGSGDVADAICDALASVGYPNARRRQLEPPLSWPLRTIGLAARHLLGSVVRGDPQRLTAGDFEVVVYATNVAIFGPRGEAQLVRAAIHRHLALTGAFLTWSEQSQALEAELTRAHRDHGGDLDTLLRRLDEIQERVDRASLTSDEWNLLYRLRLQVERDARIEAERGADRRGIGDRRRVERATSSAGTGRE